jgi:hypothetical protein
MLKSYRLPGMMPDEQIVKVLRKHFFLLFKKVIFFLVLIILPYFLYRILLLQYPGLLSGQVSYPVILIAGSTFYLFVWLFFFFTFIDYYLDVWIVTTRRIIDVRQNGFFSRTISELEIEKVQDTTSEIKGFFPTILKYGNLYVQSAGEVERFVFQQVPDPDNVRDVIIKLTSNKKTS